MDDSALVLVLGATDLNAAVCLVTDAVSSDIGRWRTTEPAAQRCERVTAVLPLVRLAGYTALVIIAKMR